MTDKHFLMPLEFVEDSIVKFIQETDLTDDNCISHVACFPAISLSKFSPKDAPYVKELYDKYTAVDTVNYYNINSAGKRAKAGTTQSSYMGSGHSGIVNLFCKVYPSDDKSYLNDSNVVRVKKFTECMQQICDSARVSELHMQLPISNEYDLKDYTEAVVDFMATFKLKSGIEPKVIIYLNGISEPNIQNLTKQNTERTKSKPRTRVAVKPKQPKLELETETETDAGIFKLILNENHIVNDAENPLYEVDFTTLVRIPDSNSKSETESMGHGSKILNYFPTDNRWLQILNDTKINKLARDVDKKLGDLIGQDNIFPPPQDMFNAFSYLISEPKIIILGQDPYHGPGQAHGLSFSVQPGFKVPPSLNNVYKALLADGQLSPKFESKPKHGYLKEWAEQGVILLNSALTVEQGKPKTHLAEWTPFTDRIIELLSNNYTKLVFMLWGGPAKTKKKLISKTNHHLVLEYCHPSTMVRNNKFPTECDHFSKANKFLVSCGKQPVDWNLKPI